ncbi:MAG: 16S rRNA (adenine(1518)-N(6)/adenine(1519)-N(6))-dimethyltransferase [Gammaproteobacteria bacterium]|nr:16S rRNA (adenine(1518)-N(6)/adenine(1519)-N(6))-dimethyltransferase [Gammaproteobacteria bacterium]
MTDMNIRHRPRKRFGQNFLSDRNIVAKIIQALGAGPQDHVIEIGPGQGVLTGELLASAASVNAIEIDRDLVSMLQQKFAVMDSFTIHESDVLKTDFNTLLSAQNPVRIIGNLPYNISTPLLFHLLAYLHGIKDMLFMLQLEVVDRLVASPGTKNYGRLSIMLQYFCQIEKLFTVPPGAFSPPPKVHSAIVRLIPKTSDQLVLQNPVTLEKLVRQAFSHRRKTLRNNLKGLLSDEELSALNIDPGLRPENLSLEDYVRISTHLEDKDG